VLGSAPHGTRTARGGEQKGAGDFPARPVDAGHEERSALGAAAARRPPPTARSRKSPFLKHGEAKCFLALGTARRSGASARQVDFDFDKQWPDEKGVAFFGFFDSKGRPGGGARAVPESGRVGAEQGPYPPARALHARFEGRHRRAVEGFDTPPRIGMPHNKPYLGKLLESAGFAKAKDFYAWWYTPGQIDERTLRIAERTLKLPNLRVRPMDLSHFRREVDIVRDIYNEAWAEELELHPVHGGRAGDHCYRV